MIGALKDMAKKSLGTYPTTPRTEWTKLYPG
jgi:hypothetical protein